jgi:outer membrane protein assembly factor BamD (BamD/ComL family)
MASISFVSWLMALAVCISPSGCTSLTQGDDKYTIKNVLGPLGREARQPRAADGSLLPLEGQDEFDKIHELVDAEKYGEAEKGFHALAKKYKNKPIEEDAMFYVAECQFLEKRYPAAQDSFDELLNKYTGSRYIEKTTKRLFAIANTWLNSPKPASEVELAAYQEGKLTKDLAAPSKPAPGSSRLLPNFTDDSRPILDTSGRAIQALKSIWLKDPTGPLADDALMMAATWFLRDKDFREADHYFTIIREQYPKSEHVQLAYVLGSHAKMMTYQGARYDGRQLEEARKLTQSTLKLFPQTPQRKQLEHDLARMKLQWAEREWEQAQLYVRKGHPKSAAIYCQSLLEEFPETPYAGKARELLAKIDPRAAKVEQASGIMAIRRHPQPEKASDPDDPSCAVPRRSSPSGTKTAAKGSKPFSPVRVAGQEKSDRREPRKLSKTVDESARELPADDDELLDVPQLPAKPSKESRTPRSESVDELDDLPPP